MTENNSVRITTMSLARRRARSTACGRARVVSEETAEPIVDVLNRGGSVAGIAAREADGKNGSRREMAPQRLEKIKSAPGNGMGSEASNLQYLVRGRTADRAAPGDGLATMTSGPAARGPVSPPRSSVYECRRSARSCHARVMAPARPRGKYSALQRLENARNGKRISIFARGPLRRAGGTPRGRAGAVGAARDPGSRPARASTNAVGRLGRATLASWAGKTEREIFRLAKP